MSNLLRHTGSGPNPRNPNPTNDPGPNSDTVAPTASPFPRPVKPAAAPLGRPTPDWQRAPRNDAARAEARRSPEPRKLDKQFTKALDKASVETERAAYKTYVLEARGVGRIHYAGLNQFIESMVRKDTDLDEYKHLINEYLDGILGKPDYRFSPHKWTDWIRGFIHNRCVEAGIKNPTNINQIRDDVLDEARKAGKMGDDAYILDVLNQEIRAFSEQIAELDWRADPDAFHKFVTEVKAGDFFVRQILGPTVAEWPPVRLEALRLVREAQAKAAVDGDGHPIAASVKPDWSAAKAAQKAVKDMQQQPAAAAPSAPAKTSGNRFSGFFKSFDTICELNKVPDDNTIRDDLRHKAAWKLYNVNSFEELPVDADLGKILAEIKAVLKSGMPGKSIGDQPKDSDNLGDWFPRDANGKPIEAKDSPSGSKIGQISNSGTVEPEKQNESKSTPSDAKNDTSKPLATNVIDASNRFQHMEAPIIVYPKDDGNVVYKGVRFFVTTRSGGTVAMARVMMDDWIANIDLIDASCLVHTAAPAALPVTNVIPMTQPAATLPMAAGQAAPVAAPVQTASGAPDKKGHVPGQTGTDTITGVKKTVDNGKTTIELWGGGRFAEHHLRRDSEHAMITALGYDVAAMVIGTTYPVNWKADWLVVAKQRNNGNYFQDVVAIRA